MLEDPPNPGPVLWDPNKVEQIQVPKEQGHQFIQDLNNGIDTSTKEYDFEESVRGWGDILRTRLHSRSVLAGYVPGDEELEDRIRLYVEECDNIQGFNILLDGTESFPEVLSFLDDEFSTKPRLTFPIVSNVGELTWKNAATRLVRIFSLYHDAAAFSTLTVPLGCMKELSMKQEVPQVFPDLLFSPTIYQTSAIIASFLDTFSLTYRTQNNPTDLSDVIAGLTVYGRKFSNASLALPFPITPNTSLQKFLEARDDKLPLYSSLTPGSSPETSLNQIFGFRGFNDNGVLLQYLQYLNSTVSSVKSITTPMPTLPPYPRIFSEHVSIKGSVDPIASRMPGFQVNQIGALAGLHTCYGLGSMLEDLSTLVSKIKINRLPEINEEVDIFREKLETMQHLAKNHSLDVDFS